MRSTSNRCEPCKPPVLDYAHATKDQVRRATTLSILSLALALLALLLHLQPMHWRERSSGAVEFHPLLTTFWIILLCSVIALSLVEWRREHRVRHPTRVCAGFAMSIALFAALLGGGNYYLALKWRGENSRSRECFSNFLTIRIALEQYRLANGGRFPQSLEELADIGLLQSRQLVCANGTVPYVYLGKTLPSDADGMEIVVYEPPSNHSGGGAFWGPMRMLHANSVTQTFREPQASQKVREIEAMLHDATP